MLKQTLQTLEKLLKTQKTAHNSLFCMAFQCLLIIMLRASSSKRHVTVWRSSVFPVGAYSMWLTKRATRDAFSIHFLPIFTRTYVLVFFGFYSTDLCNSSILVLSWCTEVAVCQWWSLLCRTQAQHTVLSHRHWKLLGQASHRLLIFGHDGPQSSLACPVLSLVAPLKHHILQYLLFSVTLGREHC